jgi:hypothetical protein
MTHTKRTTPDNRRTFNALVCDSLEDLHAYAASRRNDAGFKAIPASVLADVRQGRVDLVAKSDKLLDLIEAQTVIGYAQRQTEHTVAGGAVDVPAYLAGAPTCMLRRVRRPSPRRIRLVVDIATSGGVSRQAIERRGMATLALLRRLDAAQQPVDLYVASAMRSGDAGRDDAVIQLTRVESAPLDLARAAYVLTQDDFQRQFCFQICCGIPGLAYSKYTSILWPWDAARYSTHWTRDHEAQKLVYATALDIDGADLMVLPPVHVDEAENFTSDEKAVAWANAMYKQAMDMLSAD